jgi:hypothetical protein
MTGCCFKRRWPFPIFTPDDDGRPQFSSLLLSCTEEEPTGCKKKTLTRTSNIKLAIHFCVSFSLVGRTKDVLSVCKLVPAKRINWKKITML